jgi:hypothetical protein
MIFDGLIAPASESGFENRSVVEVVPFSQFYDALSEEVI